MAQTQSSVKGKDFPGDDKWMSGRLIGGPNEETKKLGRREGVSSKPPEVGFRKVTGNLRFPLDFTYHGRPLGVPISF